MEFVYELNFRSLVSTELLPHGGCGLRFRLQRSKVGSVFLKVLGLRVHVLLLILEGGFGVVNTAKEVVVLRVVVVRIMLIFPWLRAAVRLRLLIGGWLRLSLRYRLTGEAPGGREEGVEHNNF